MVWLRNILRIFTVLHSKKLQYILAISQNNDEYFPKLAISCYFMFEHGGVNSVSLTMTDREIIFSFFSHKELFLLFLKPNLRFIR
jgi:hypothetical protein